MPEVSEMAYRMLRFIFRKVDVSKDILITLIDSMAADGDGRLTLSEVAIALKMLWKKAMGKVKAPKTKVLD